MIDERTDGGCTTTGRMMNNTRPDRLRMNDVRTDGRRVNDIRAEGRRMNDVRTEGRRMNDVRAETRRMNGERNKRGRTIYARTGERKMNDDQDMTITRISFLPKFVELTLYFY